MRHAQLQLILITRCKELANPYGMRHAHQIVVISADRCPTYRYGVASLNVIT